MDSCLSARGIAAAVIQTTRVPGQTRFFWLLPPFSSVNRSCAAVKCRSGLVVRSQLRDRRALGSKPDSTEGPSVLSVLNQT
ncbi:hypothetical protein AVEN_248081-1 [Araneus ventricosus]|uniref:Uncharacterized protein n=1 Tax=Araneus ventricosus TaxID=182803 RepID=A0A4Y2MTA2_ARAVE|nr:hypothetical protein AVEN_248081-1 [Araneus ventricosus]